MLSVASVNCLLLRGGRHRGVVSFIGCRAHDVCKTSQVMIYLQTSTISISSSNSHVRNNGRRVINMKSNDKSGDDSMISNKEGRQSASTSTTPWENPKSLVRLLEKTTSRAMRTLSTNTINTDEDFAATKDPTVQNVMDAAIIRSSSILDKDTNDDISSNDIVEPTEQTKQTEETTSR